MSQSNNWSCPGCNAVVVYKGYGRRGKYCTRDCNLTHKKLLRKAETLARREIRAPLRRLSQRKKFLSLFCKHCKAPLPPKGKLFCTRECYYRHRYRRRTDRIPPKCEAAKTEKNLREAGNCTICGGTLARSGWYKITPHPMIPPGIELCANHRRRFGCFVSANSYTNMDIDEVWTAFLVHLTFGNSGGQPYLVMMREALHSGERK